MTTTQRPGPSARGAVPFGDAVAAAWIQHRTALITSTAFVVLLAAAALAYSGILLQLAPTTTGNVVLLVDLVALLVGILLGAPLVAREHEQGTSHWAASQDVSPTRRLVGACVLLLGVVVVWASALGLTTARLVDGFPALARRFDTLFFEASPVVQIGYTVFALALGVFCGALTHRTVPAMGLTLVGFLLARYAVLLVGRPSYLPPVHTVTPIGTVGPGVNDPIVGTVVRTGLLDGQGREATLPADCRTGLDFPACLRRGGITSTYVDYQPADRLLEFRLVEAGLFLGAALVLIVATLVAIRRLRADR